MYISLYFLSYSQPLSTRTQQVGQASLLHGTQPLAVSGIAAAWRAAAGLGLDHLACPVYMRPMQGLGWILVGILATTLGWYLKNIFGRKKTILALLRSTRSARKNLARLRTLMRSGKDPRRQRSLSSVQ